MKIFIDGEEMSPAEVGAALGHAADQVIKTAAWRSAAGGAVALSALGVGAGAASSRKANLQDQQMADMGFISQEAATKRKLKRTLLAATGGGALGLSGGALAGLGAHLGGHYVSNRLAEGINARTSRAMQGFITTLEDAGESLRRNWNRDQAGVTETMARAARGMTEEVLGTVTDPIRVEQLQNVARDVGGALAEGIGQQVRQGTGGVAKSLKEEITNILLPWRWFRKKPPVLPEPS